MERVGKGRSASGPTRAGAIVLALVFASLAPVWLPGTAHACSCEVFDADRSFAGADAVFVGEAVEVRTAAVGEPAEFERRYVFEVTDVFKGEVFATQSVVSSTESSACGLPWDQAGAIALVFGYAGRGADTIVPGELYASQCDTGPLTVLPATSAFASPVPPLDGVSPIGIAPPATPAGGSVRFSWEWVAVGVLLLVGVIVGAWPRRRSNLPERSAGQPLDAG